MLNRRTDAENGLSDQNLSSPCQKRGEDIAATVFLPTIIMPKIGRPDSYWRDICNGLAAGKTPSQMELKKGWRPGTNNNWKTVIQKVEACGETKKRQSSSQSTLPFGGEVTCTCNWDHDNETTAAAAAAAAPAAAAMRRHM